MNRAEVLALLKYVSERWPSYPLPTERADLEVRIMVWGDALGDLDAPFVRAAIVSLGGEFVPPLDRIRREARRLADPDADLPDAAEAFDEIRRAFGTHGHLREPEWSHPAIGLAVRGMGGWRAMCLSTDPIGVTLGHWRRVYESVSERVHREAALPPAVAALLLGDGSASAAIAQVADSLGSLST